MSDATKSKPNTSDISKCVTRSVVDVLAKEPTLEAVTINRGEHKISLATLGQADVLRLTTRLTEQIERAQNSDVDAPCGLLDGGGSCTKCDGPLSSDELRKITIRQDAQSTTIARITCPTAPKFWRWRDIPFPKLAPREIELPDDDEHIDEWKMQLVAAILCGVFGITGFALKKYG
ncbi:MAG TPA: cation-transporting P-type ATPase, partial [Verrucomicrobiae bacterium]|nr:cation-transporting P-type ATPase [Verrucomicrobiae bacterium]